MHYDGVNTVCVCVCFFVCLFVLLSKENVYLFTENCFLKLSDMNNLITWVYFIVRFNSHMFFTCSLLYSYT